MELEKIIRVMAYVLKEGVNNLILTCVGLSGNDLNPLNM